MAAHIPEYRRAINGRTFDREWSAYAGEHYRAPRWDRWAGVALAVAIGVAGALALVAWSTQ